MAADHRVAIDREKGLSGATTTPKLENPQAVKEARKNNGTIWHEEAKRGSLNSYEL